MIDATILRAARELLSDSARWATGFYAYAEDGEMVDGDDPDACSWCLVGAIWKVGGWDAADNARYALAACVPASFVSDGTALVTQFNDEHATHADVLRVLDCAIARAEA